MHCHDDFVKLTTEELQQLFDQRYENEKVRRIIKNEKGNDAKFVLRREHAFALYWKRRFDSSKKLTDDDIHTIFSYSEFSVSEGILGDAATMGLLSQHQCSEILKRISEDGWAYKAVMARILVSEFTAARRANQLTEEYESNDYEAAEVLDKLISLKMTWAILELIQYLKSGELNELRHAMENKSVLTRWNRHLVREETDKFLKIRRQKKRKKI